MSDDPLDYARLVREALLEVPRRALLQAAREGLPEEHHFYVSFRTTHPGVSISPALRARHPEEMTVILQHQYWDLAVGEDAFSVTLRFGGAPERLHVPFTALTAFADPPAEFGLRFDGSDDAQVVKEPRDAEGAEGEEPPADNVVDIREFRRPEAPEPEPKEEEEPEPAG
jgi:hypothetical protein